MKSGIYFANNTTPNILGDFSLILPNIFFELRETKLVYTKGKVKTKVRLSRKNQQKIPVRNDY